MAARNDLHLRARDIAVGAASSVKILSALFGFALTTAYWPGISGAATTPRWDVAAMLAVALFFAPRVRMAGSHWLGLVLIAWLILSLAWSEGRLDGIDASFKLGLAAVAFAVGSTMTDLRPLMLGATLGIAVSSGFAIAQWFGWTGLETYDNRIAGLFFNRDRCAAAAAMVAIWLLNGPARLWLLLPLIAPALILPQSRGAWLAVAAGVLARRRYSRRQALALGAAASAVGMAVCIALIVGSPIGIDQRIALWSDTISALTPFGHGLGSFWESFPAHANHFSIAIERPEHPHSEWFWLAYEGGLPAISLGGLFAVLVWREAVDRSLLAGLFVLSLFAMPFHDPVTLILGALCAGHLTGWRCADGSEAVDRGSPVLQGMAAGNGQRRAF